MSNLPEHNPSVSGILRQPTKIEYKRGNPPPSNVIANYNRAHRNNNPPVSVYSPMPTMAHMQTMPLSLHPANRNRMMEPIPSYLMAPPMDPMRALLTYQAQENVAARQDAAERQTQMSQMIMEVTKMMLEEQRQNREFQKEMIEMFATKLSEKSVASAAPSFAMLPAPSQSTAGPIRNDSDFVFHDIPTTRTVAYTPYPRKIRTQRVMHNKKQIGTAKDYDETIGFTSFVCRRCGEELPSRDDLIEHSRDNH